MHLRCVRFWPFATNSTGLAEVSFLSESRRNLLAKSIAARDPIPEFRRWPILKNPWLNSFLCGLINENEVRAG
jgi:hypothetical protein